MHIIKPQVLGLSFRPIEFKKRFGLCVSGYLHIPFAQVPGGSLWSEQSMWNFLAEEMEVPLIDEGVTKLTSEFLVHGRAYPTLERKNAVAVRARLGEREKTILVFGDRFWEDRAPSVPRSFKEMPISWDRAYGGPDYAANLKGRGRVDCDGIRWLPNLELPHSRLLRPDQEIIPAGFSSLEIVHPQRAALRGTYDDKWLEEHSPGFPPDVDWRHFNLAASDQRFGQPLKGDESYSLDNMHPSRPLIEGCLPGLRVRAFANHSLAGPSGEEKKLREIPMRLNTVWFFPHAERMVLVFQGLDQVTEDDASDIRQLMGAVERLDEARSSEHYVGVLEKRLDPRRAAAQLFNDADLISPGIDTVDPNIEKIQAAMKSDGLREDAIYRRAAVDVENAREKVRAQGKDPDALGIILPPREKPPTAAEMPAYIERMQEEIERQQWAAIESAVTHLEKTIEFKAKGKLHPEKLVGSGPPSYRAASHLIQLENGFKRAGKSFDKGLFAESLAKKEFMDRLNYQKNAHIQAPAPVLQGEASREKREEIEWLLAHGTRQFLGFNLTGADLSNLDLRGANFTGAWLESANLAGSNLSRSIFASAVLAHADLQGAIAIQANFQGANLGRAKLRGVVFDRSEFAGTMFNHCDMAGTQFCEAKLAGPDLMDTVWGPCDFTRANINGVTLYKRDMKGSIFADAKIAGSNFIECDLEGVDFRACEISGTSFVTCNVQKSMFSDASLPGVTFVQGTELMFSDFSRANLKGANLGECDLSGARMIGANLDGANLGLANMSECDLGTATAKGALFRKTVLRGARLSSADLKDAILQHADLRGADLSNANLFGADLSRVKLDGTVRFNGALLERTRTWPRLTPEQNRSAP